MTPWENFDGHPYTRETFKVHVETIPVASLKWCRFITLHNTGSPTLKQWMQGGNAAQRIKNLQHLYRDIDHWHQGPHAFIANDYIWGFSPFTEPGVHASCFNPRSIGIEMAGDFASEAFDVKPGSDVRDNMIFALAVLHNHIGIRPDKFQYNIAGLHFHQECKADGHACPGKHVVKSDVVERILAAMKDPSTQTTPVAAA